MIRFTLPVTETGIYVSFVDLILGQL